MDLLATALHPHLYNTSQKISHLQRCSKKGKKQNNKWVSSSNLGNTNDVFTDSFCDISFPNCYINLCIKLALAKVKARA